MNLKILLSLFLSCQEVVIIQDYVIKDYDENLFLICFVLYNYYIGTDVASNHNYSQGHKCVIKNSIKNFNHCLSLYSIKFKRT